MTTGSDVFPPLAGGSITNNLRLFRENRLKITRRNIRKVARIVIWSALNRGPAFLDNLFYDRKVQKAEITNGPVFITGHWRSGTTFLHNLLTQDDRFGYMNFFQALCPDFFLWRPNRLGRIVDRRIPDVRPGDFVKLGAGLPQEDEFALANMMTQSCYHSLYFPVSDTNYLAKYLNIDELDDGDKTRWCQTITLLYKRLTFANQGKPLVLKNPAHTSRISVLKKLFPKAKFIYLIRDPYEVYSSSIAFIGDMLTMLSLQDGDLAALPPAVISNYVQLLKKVPEFVEILPKNDIVTVKYESLVSHPVDVLKLIYERLDLGSFEVVKAKTEAFLRATAPPAKKVYQLGKEDKHLLSELWLPLYRSHLQFVDI